MSMRRNGRGRRSRSLAFSPADLTGAAFEYNFASANVTKDGSNLIAQVNDLSANSRDVTQSTGGNKPLWVSAMRGVDGGTFDTGGVAFKRLLKSGLGAVFSHYEWTLACVARCTTASAGSTMFPVVNVSNSATGREGPGQLGYYATNRTRRITCLTAAGASSAVTFGDAPLNTFERWIVRVQGTSNGGAATVTAFVDGVSQALTGSLTCNNVAANGSIILGTPSISGAVDMLYVKGWNRALNDASLSALDTALQAY